MRSVVDTASAGGGIITHFASGQALRGPVRIRPMTSIDRTAFLAGIELFQGVPDHLLADVAAQMEEVRYSAGNSIFERGDDGDAMYMVVEGTLSLEADGISLLVRTPGECVGEFALIDNEPRSAAAVARTDVILLRWHRRHFLEALGQDIAVAQGIFKMLTGKLREDVETRVQLRLAQERWEHDLARAHEIQMGMLPLHPYRSKYLDIAGYCAPATQVGGDYFDYLSLDKSSGRTGLVIGDVTGHGFYSGLFVAMAKSAIHTQAPVDYSPAAMMGSMRQAVDLSIDRRLLMSCCYVLLDPVDMQLCYANAGHPPPLLLRSRTGELEQLPAIDTLLGVLDIDIQPAFGESGAEWHPGDLLVMYSDGVIEARGPNGNMFGEQRFQECVKAAKGLSAKQTVEQIVAAVSAFGAGESVGDDLTLLAVRGH